MSSEQYHKNSLRVREIYGYAPDDHTVNIHHIVMRHDVSRLVPKDFDIDGISNLYPLKIRTHEELHHMVDLMELDYRLFKKEKKKKIVIK